MPSIERNTFELSKGGKNSKLQLILILLPGMTIFLLFTIYPIVKLLTMSFFDWNLGIHQQSFFIGLQNYRDVLSDPIGMHAIKNTICYTLITVPSQIVIGLIIALMITSIKRFQIVYRTAYYLPVITSWVIVSILYRYIFNNEGLLNYLLVDRFYLFAANIQWLDNPFTAFFVIDSLGIWKGVGWNMVLFIAALSTVPIELYESAELDGCGEYKKFVSITLPSIRENLLFAVVMLTIGGFNVYTSIKLLTDGEPMHKTEVTLTWMYRQAFVNREFGYAAALSFIVTIIITVLALLQFKLFGRGNKNS